MEDTSKLKVEKIETSSDLLDNLVLLFFEPIGNNKWRNRRTGEVETGYAKP